MMTFGKNFLTEAERTSILGYCTSLKCRIMDKLNNRKVKANVNTSYQRDIERSFSVIYHNLKRIQEERSKEGNLMSRNSEPHLSSPNAALPQRNEETGVLQRSNSSKGSNPLRGKTRRFTETILQ
ncbi:uncharacterized protein [Montipora capricornis]|uniref:uncharacterized protein n=1 Tax=Montipora capricornis TaxID=246305 RepID=UPI0035F1387B